MTLVERRVLVSPDRGVVGGFWQRHEDTAHGYLFLAPFLAVYAVFLIFPLLKGVWISLHDWNLMAVAFNPDAKEYVGLENFRFLWGRDMIWGLEQLWDLRAVILIATLILWYLVWRGAVTYRAAAWTSVAAVFLFVALGFHPDEGGRWFDRRFWPIVGNTFVFMGLTVPGVVAVGLALAIALNRPTRMMAAFRTVFFLSHVLSVAVVTLMWSFIFNPRQGIIAHITRMFGGEPVVWLTDQYLAMPSIVIATIWWSVGFAMVIFLAGLQAIPEERYEAAKLDGAGSWALFRHITIPGLRRPLVLVIVLQTIAHFQVFGQSALMTQGGPNDVTQVLVRYIYQTGFRDSELGSAAALSLFLFAVMLVFALVQLRLSRSEAE
ncbi:carbohydrate ABC transporter permease [Bauldia sp.]|uniref:carbohydrate ABC transporter permease n=1 Tax=Bauldia sp. TaxID=2575872 RepID=UPI003BAA0B3C